MARPMHLKLLSGLAVEDGPFFQPAPLHPPLEWFSDEAADAAPERFTVYPDGSAAGIVAPAGRCLLSMDPNECWTVPRPRDGRGSTIDGRGGMAEEYYMANQGGTICADGSFAATGVLAGEGGHARPGIRPDHAQSHYADTKYQQARIRYVWSDTAGNGVGGVVAVGCLWPEVTERDVAGILASATSIDFRYLVDERCYRLVGTTLVNIGGLPTRYVAALEAPGGGQLALTEQWEPEADVPLEFVAALALGEAATVPDMNRRRVRYCQTCPPVDRTAAFRAVSPAGPAWFAEVTYSGGSGAFLEAMTDASGAEVWIVHPVVNDTIDDTERIVVAVADATLTGRRFEWVDVDSMAVVDESVAADDYDNPVVAAARTAAAELPGDAESKLVERIGALETKLDEVESMVREMYNAQLEDALST